MSDSAGTPGWYPDPYGRAELRFFDGEQWSSYALRDGVEFVDRITHATQPRPEAQAAAGAEIPAAAGARLATAGVIARNATGQVVIGPTLPTFAALGRSTGRRSLSALVHKPAVLLAVTTLLAVVPAMATDTHGADTFAQIRLGAGLLAAAGAALLPRLSGNAAKIAKLLPLVFVALQLVAMATTISAFTSGDSGVGAALPHLIGGLITVVSAGRLAWSQRQAGLPADSAATPPIPAA